MLNSQTILILSVILLSNSFSFAQSRTENLHNPTAIQECLIHTKRGDRIVAVVVESDSQLVRVKLKNDTLTFFMDEIRKIETVLKDSILKEVNSFHIKPSNGYLTPSSFGLLKGEWEYRNTWLLMNTIDYGLTDWLSVGANALPYFIIAAGTIRLKAWYSLNDYMRLSQGFQFGLGYDFLNNSPEAEPIAISTSSISLGTHRAFMAIAIHRLWSSGTSWLITWNGSVSLSPKWKIRCEFANLDDTRMIAIGPSFNWKNNLIDVGLGYEIPEADFIFPAITYTTRFGKMH